VEKGVGDEGVEALAADQRGGEVIGRRHPEIGRRGRVGAGIPFGGIDLRNRLDDTNDGGRLHGPTLTRELRPANHGVDPSFMGL